MWGVCAHTPVPVMLTQWEQRQSPLRGKGGERGFWELGALAWGGGREAGSGRLSRIWRAALSKEHCYWAEEPRGLLGFMTLSNLTFLCPLSSVGIIIDAARSCFEDQRN